MHSLWTVEDHGVAPRGLGSEPDDRPGCSGVQNASPQRIPLRVPSITALRNSLGKRQRKGMWDPWRNLLVLGGALVADRLGAASASGLLAFLLASESGQGFVRNLEQSHQSRQSSPANTPLTRGEAERPLANSQSIERDFVRSAHV